jgi:hypothetical protein
MFYFINWERFADTVKYIHPNDFTEAEADKIKKLHAARTSM